jgi:hypothetical protein
VSVELTRGFEFDVGVHVELERSIGVGSALRNVSQGAKWQMQMRIHVELNGFIWFISDLNRGETALR